MKFSLLLIPLAMYGQQTVSLHVSGKVESAKVSETDFGRLRKGLREANWIVTSDSPVAAKIPLAAIIQLIQPVAGRSGVSILMPHSSTAAVQDAQGNSAIAKVTRIGTGVLGGFEACEGARVCPQGGSWSKVTIGAVIFAFALQYVVPEIPSHALQSITSMMPDPVVLDPYGTVPGAIIVELAKHTPDPGTLDETIQVTIPK